MDWNQDFGVDTAGDISAPSFGGGGSAAAGAAATLGSTAATMGISFAVNAGKNMIDQLFANDAQNRKNASLRKQHRLKHKYKVDQLKANYQNAWDKTDSYNEGLVAAHNARVDQYDANIALLQTEESFAYEAAQLNAGAEVASFMEDNLDLLKGFIQGGGQLAAAGITSGSAQLAEMKNYVGGYLEARSRRRGAAAGAIGGVLRDMKKLELMGNAKRDAMYAAVKNKPVLRKYPTMPPIPAYQTPGHLKNVGMDWGKVAMEGGWAAFNEVGGVDLITKGLSSLF